MVCRMGGMYRMQDLFELVAHQGAEELQLEPGRPPVMVLHGKARVVDGTLVTSDVVAELFRSIATDEQAQELLRCGDIHFNFMAQHSARFKIHAAVDGGHLKLTARNLSR